MTPDTTPSPATREENLFTELTRIILFLEDEDYGVTVQRLMSIRDGFRQMEKEHREMRAGYTETLEAFAYVVSALADMGQGVPSFDFEKHQKILDSTPIR